MNIYINLQFLNEIKSGDLITFLAVILAYIAYVWSVNRDLESWKSLFVSFKNDLHNQRPWLGSEYYKETYKDKNSYNPYKIIFPLSFESLPEIIRRGIAELPWISSKFAKRLSLFNERIIAFNNLLDYAKEIVTTNPLVTEKLKDKLNNLGLDKGSIEFDDLKKKINEAKKTDEDFYLAEQIRRINKVIHVGMISNKNNEDKLCYLYNEINGELDKIIKNFDKKKPFFVKYKWIVILLSIIFFIFIELSI